MKKIFLLIILISFVFCLSCNNEGKKDDEITYIVTFINDEKAEEVIVKKNEKVNKPLDLMKEGFDFLGWYLNDELFNFETPIESNITLKAKYEEVIRTYNVKIVFDKYELELIDKKEFSINDVPKVEGYEYIGLYTDSLYQKEFNGK